MSEEDTKSWIYAGGLPYELTEGDVVCVFSQYGEILEISLARDKDTGKSRGFGFIKYEDPRSCELAVDNLNGASIVGRKIKVSYATNANAMKNRKAAVVAPTEDSTLPEVQDITKSKRDNNPSIDPGERLLKPKYLECTISQEQNERHDREHDRDRRFGVQESRDEIGRRRSPDGSPRPKHHRRRDSSPNSDSSLVDRYRSSKYDKHDRSRHKKSKHRHKHKSSDTHKSSRHRNERKRSRSRSREKISERRHHSLRDSRSHRN